MKTRAIFLALVMCLVAVSCRNASQKGSGVKTKESVETASAIPVIDTIRVSDHFQLCEQKLTGADYILSILGPDDGTYDNEVTSPEAAFFVPEPGIKQDETCRLVTLRYNCAAVMNRVIHSYELFERKAYGDQLDSTSTRRDTLDVIAHDQPRYRLSALGKYIQEPAALKEARLLLSAYRGFDGNQETLDAAFERYGKFFGTLPELASKELLDDFQEHFWEWYDKSRHVPEIDDITRLRLRDSEVKLTQEQYDRMIEAQYGETDIDRRAILAIEVAHHADGILQLGEIIESGIYTKYLLEVWLLWRAQVQMHAIGPSSFCTIPNNYFDQMRVKCMNTILRHMQTDPDRYDACLLENFIEASILDRQASIAGNESLATLCELKWGGFVDPKLLE